MNNDFERKLRQQLRAGELTLDDGTRHRLDAARQKAVAQNGRLPFSRVLWPLGGMTLASLVLFLLVVSPLAPTVNQEQDPLALESTETQDLDFYYWLAETKNVSEI